MTRKHSAPIVCPELEAVRAELKVNRSVRVRSTACTTAPITVGLFRTTLLLPNGAMDYYTPGEEVFVGTGEAQNAYHPVDENGNKRFVKRIVTNEQGEAMFVVTVEHQNPEFIASMSRTSTASMEGYTDGIVRTISYNAYGELVFHSTGIFVYERVSENEFAYIAYIPPALQINCYAYNYSPPTV